MGTHLNHHDLQVIVEPADPFGLGSERLQDLVSRHEQVIFRLDGSDPSQLLISGPDVQARKPDDQVSLRGSVFEAEEADDR